MCASAGAKRKYSSTVSTLGIQESHAMAGYKRQVHPQSDGGSGKGEASNHPALVPDCIASQNEPHSERGRYNPGRTQPEKSCGSDPASLRMGRDPVDRDPVDLDERPAKC
jgi:hypothetical protein